MREFYCSQARPRLNAALRDGLARDGARTGGIGVQ